MVTTKGVERSVANWKGAAAVIPGRYRDGVTAVTNWRGAALAADEFWKQAMQEAISTNSRKRGLEATSETTWKDGALNKGAVRIGPGIAAAEPAFRSGITKVIGVIEGITLPPRTVDPAQNVTNRVTPIAVALHALKHA